jgi:hypothetical protein
MMTRVARFSAPVTELTVIPRSSSQRLPESLRWTASTFTAHRVIALLTELTLRRAAPERQARHGDPGGKVQRARHRVDCHSTLKLSEALRYFEKGSNVHDDIIYLYKMNRR